MESGEGPVKCGTGGHSHRGGQSLLWAESGIQLASGGGSWEMLELNFEG